MSTGTDMIARPTGGQIAESMPDFLRDEKPIGVADMLKYIRPPFVKIVQGSADKTLKQKYKEGSLVLAQNDELLLDANAVMTFTPVYFFTEYITMNPIELKGTQPMIRARSFDPNSEIARKALDPSTRNEQIGVDASTGKPLILSHQEVLCFFLKVHSRSDGGEVPEDVVLLTFSRAEWRTGSRLARLIAQRNKPVFSGVYEAQIGIHRNTQHDWYGLDIDNPKEPTSPWVDQELYEKLKKTYDVFADAHKRGAVQTTYEEAPGPAGNVHEGAPDGVVEAGANY